MTSAFSSPRPLGRGTTPRRAPAEVFWEPQATDHSLQIYADAESFLDALEGFASGGFRAGESVIVIATAAHRGALERRLHARGFDLDPLKRADRYIPIDAEAALARFMVANRPDPQRFQSFVAGLLARARGSGWRVRAFGEMVALLWQQDQREATLELESLWNQLHAQAGFSLFCAYPRAGFASADAAAITAVCAQHTRVLPE